MGRKPKASKMLITKQPLAANLPPEGITSAPDGNLDNIVGNNGSLLSNSPRAGKKRSEISAVFVRRSNRLQFASENPVLEPVDHAIVSDTECNIEETEKTKEDDQTLRAVELHNSPLHTSNETYRNSEEENPGVVDLKYKAMYINSQKKIESLMEKNKELNGALEHACGKLDVYEKQGNIYSEVMNVLASMSKVNENLSEQVKRGHASSSVYLDENGIRASKKSKVVKSGK